MGSPQRIPNKEPQQVIHLSPCNSITRRRRISNDSNSPEFEFWMVRNPSFPQPNLLSADELFVDGVLLPLHLLHNNNNHHHHPDEPEPEHQLEPEPPNLLLPDQEPQVSPANITLEPTNSSKRWRDIIFKKSHDKKTSASKKQEEKEKKREKKKGLSGAGSAELNINIWPFSRSRSAGNSGSRPKMVPGPPGIRKVSSAPCSRSNSSGESKSRKSWPSSPGRSGVHLGRSSPVWQVRRRGGVSVTKGDVSEHVVRSGEKVASKKEVINEARRSKNATDGNGSARAKVLNINVPMCIGYRSHLSCGSDENSAIGVGDGSKNVSGGGGGGGGGRSSGTINVGIGGNLFNLRSLFNKKCTGFP